ncbi:hypothetical protein [Chitinophaga pinensis]|uniref:Uncharacterized protein n=1 Tax=Chitinophaga pinensis (strain ATCC 43595 / DSM 2588 / LMG 13176 / NBRC 15968 / NCIMB 11800 / UQM 2034) TaxID=485918 RepID=A0A979GQZ1_CHIPD|nr:hypothetical protein [Chitinophaga pinensis]ACU58474.1 hypothetical protein Cpin_0976 [Chitinophaga pinensis DSM 2588]
MISLKQFSVLSVVLVAASAVTAAVVPSKKTSKVAFAANGRLQATATPRVANQQTCKVVSSGAATCFDTATATNGSLTSGIGAASSLTLTGAANGNNTTIGDIS